MGKVNFSTTITIESGNTTVAIEHRFGRRKNAGLAQQKVTIALTALKALGLQVSATKPKRLR